MPKLAYRVHQQRRKTLDNVMYLMSRGIVSERAAIESIYKRSKRHNKTGFSVDKGFDSFYSQYRMFKCRLPDKEVISFKQYQY